MKGTRLLAASVTAGVLALGFATTAGAEPAPAAKATAADQPATAVDDVTTAAVPGCISATKYVLGDGEKWGVQVSNSCSNPKRIKVKVGLWTDSKCKKIPPQHTFPDNYRWFGNWYVPTYYKGVASC